MAKGTISKPQKGASRHSRAARRATSPGINTDKSLKALKAPEESVDNRPAVLAVHHAGGVTKKNKRKTAMSSKARVRQEKAMDRAEAVMDQTALKVKKSKGHFKVIQSRKKPWEEFNKLALLELENVAVAKKPFKHLEEDDSAAALDDDDEDMGDVAEVGVSAVATPIVPALISTSAPVGDDDEIL
ncbi:Alb1-domain-containing protein [Lasiosphaeria hispida]|uniref:Alb1-domain-containing protein n=1 Tax=Lasiosphaeria hispida TaxID=260671 RepID=A0AAJ0HQ95_9PEZI|nr:Alb1-domain-containing protein [Lasiosphaeria hispida]